tara:strand:+ start:258 stop:725 length:468 start_codon:yes stop_codon:yes gene_type:complete
MAKNRFSYLAPQARKAAASGISRNQWLRDLTAAGVRYRRQDMLNFAGDYWSGARKSHTVRNIPKGLKISRALHHEPKIEVLHKRFVYNVGFDIKNNTTGRVDRFYQYIGSDRMLDVGGATNQGFSAVFNMLDKSQIEIRNTWVEEALHRPGDIWI